mmetsp:Transcript_29601/g.60471  ORF Transcript_29601/g.60471 Transcript_29601/m.60471 type:complete len:270 (-) Transcript_29601:139-948(-)
MSCGIIQREETILLIFVPGSGIRGSVCHVCIIIAFMIIIMSIIRQLFSKGQFLFHNTNTNCIIQHLQSLHPLPFRLLLRLHQRHLQHFTYLHTPLLPQLGRHPQLPRFQFASPRKIETAHLPVFVITPSQEAIARQFLPVGWIEERGDGDGFSRFVGEEGKGGSEGRVMQRERGGFAIVRVNDRRGFRRIAISIAISISIAITAADPHLRQTKMPQRRHRRQRARIHRIAPVVQQGHFHVESPYPFSGFDAEGFGVDGSSDEQGPFEEA